MAAKIRTKPAQKLGSAKAKYFGKIKIPIYVKLLQLTKPVHTYQSGV